MYLFAEYKAYKELKEKIIQGIILEATREQGDANIYPVVFDADFTLKLQAELDKIVSEQRVAECINEIIMGPHQLIYDLNLKKYWMVMAPKDKEEVLNGDQFYMSKLYQPFVTKYKEEVVAEAHYDAFHNYFKIPALLLYERYLRGFLKDFLQDHVKIFFRVDNKKAVPVTNQFVLDNKHRTIVQMIKWKIAKIIELKWVLLYVNEFDLSLMPVPPGTPSKN